HGGGIERRPGIAACGCCGAKCRVCRRLLRSLTRCSQGGEARRHTFGESRRGDNLRNRGCPPRLSSSIPTEESAVMLPAAIIEAMGRAARTKRRRVWFDAGVRDLWFTFRQLTTA